MITNFIKLISIPFFFSFLLIISIHSQAEPTPFSRSSLTTPTPTPVSENFQRFAPYAVNTLIISDPAYISDTWNGWNTSNFNDNFEEHPGLQVLWPDYDQYVWGNIWFQFDINQFFSDQYGYDYHQYRITDFKVRLHFRSISTGRQRFQTLYLHQPNSVWDVNTLVTNNMPDTTRLFSFAPQYNGWTEIGDPQLTDLFNEYRLAGLHSDDWKKGISIHPINEGTGLYPGTEIWWDSIQTENPEYRPQFVITYETGPPSTPTPVPSELAFSNFNEPDDWDIAAPKGYRQGRISFNTIPTGDGTDGNGLKIDISPGQGVWLSNKFPITVNGYANISASFRGTSSSIEAAIVTLNYPVEGQYGYSHFTGPAIPYGEYKKYHLLYRPPSEQLIVAIQAVNPLHSLFTQTLYVDELKVTTTTPSYEDSEITEVHGSFDYGLHNLIANINEADGAILPFFQSLTDVAIRLSLQPKHTAANIGIPCIDLEERFPFNLIAGITAIRDTPSFGGTCGMVITNGYHNLGVFQSVDFLPESENEQLDPMIIGGNFTANNPTTPLHVFVQNSGQEVESEIIADDLFLNVIIKDN